MPDPVPVVVAADDPNKPGVTTSEYKLTRAVMIAGAVLAALITLFSQLKTTMPDAGWIGSALSLLGVLGTVLAVASKYVGGRSDVKVAQLQVEAANVHAEAAKIVAVANGSPSAPPAR